MPPGSKYNARAAAFAQAIEIGVAVYERHPPPDEDGLPHAPAPAFATQSRGLARQALEPAPAFATLKSLAYLEDAFFTFWNESRGPHATVFWQKIAKAGRPFTRKDVVGGILKRGRIRTVIEHEHAVDAIGGAPPPDRERLVIAIAEYELRKKSKRG